MKRIRPPRPPRSAPDIETLLKDARALGLSSSRLEDAYWETRLSDQIDALLKAKDDDALNAALDHLYQSDDRGYDGLVDMIESRTESHSIGGDQGDDLLLIAIPILAWSRYSIPSGPIAASVLANLRTHLLAHVLAADTRLALADALFSPDQIPPGFSATARFTGQLGRAAQQNIDFHVDAGQLPEAMHFLSDNRYILAAVAVKHGAPIFRWQEQDGNRDQAEAQWKQQGGEVLRTLFPGCAIEPRLPLAFFSACRDADRAARGYAIQASAAFLCATFPEAADQLQAVIAPFHDRRLTEYRIGFTLADGAKVIHGVVWPLLDAEDENSDIPGQVEGLLTAAGVKQVTFLDHAFPAEYCDDCGAPYYPNQDGETVHAEMPEEEGTAHSRHLH